MPFASENDIKLEILTNFGSPVVKVEIDETQWDWIFKRAKRWFQAKKGLMGCGLYPASSPFTPTSDMAAVIDIVLPGDGAGGIGCLTTFGFFDDLVPADIFNGNGSTANSTFTNYSQWLQVLQQFEQIQRITGTEPGWYEACGKIYLNGNPSGVMLVLYKRATWSVADLKDRDEDLFYRAAMNEARYVLARIRGKYQSYPAAGGSVETDASGLMDEYREERERLEEEISASAMPIGPVTG